MLTKILNIEGIGLLRDVKDGKGKTFQPVSLIYAENGRGKSTFASILNSCALRNSDSISDRVTIDADVAPAAKLLFGSAQAEYSLGSWSGFTPELIVYDGAFVAENVHTGSDVTPSQRANLLEFALGTSAVQARKDEVLASQQERAASDRVKQLRGHLEALIADVTTLPRFRAIAKDPDINRKMANAEQRLAAVTRSVEIRRLPTPRPQEVPSLDISNLFEVLNSTLDGVHSKAAARVKDHLTHLADPHSSAWVQKGLELQAADECPFCGQNTSEVELLQMYRDYFDQEYIQLQATVKSTLTAALSAIDPSVIDRWAEIRDRNNEAIKQWSEFVSLTLLPVDTDDRAAAALDDLRKLLERLRAQKLSSITEAHGSEADFSEAERLWSQARAPYDAENGILHGYNESIESYQQSLESTTLADAKSQLELLRLEELRFKQTTLETLDALKLAEGALKGAEKAKKSARDALNVIMSSTLSRFKDDINNHLDSFNADFRIAEFTSNYRGNNPRVEYRIQLRGEAIQLAGGRPTFATALSEGDKKTMGFAFFAASTLADPDLDKKIVVIDDPMSSLDAPRRDHTIEIIDRIAATSDQLILMAHDAHFLRSVRERIRKNPGATGPAEIHLKMTQGRYSDFGELDLDALCQSDYLADYKRVSDVVSGKVNDIEGVALVAVALRPLLEGYLHRKYPGAIPAGVTLGKAIAEIEQSAGTGSPCAEMAHRAGELKDLNRLTSQVHHNTQPDMAGARRESHQTIVRNGERILKFIHSA